MSSLVEDAPARRTSTSMPELVVEVMWNQGPGAADGDWCDITPYVVGWWYEHGRENELEDFDAGRGEVEVETFDRLFDPSYTSGPWYPWLKVNRQIRIYEVLDDGTRNPCGRGYIRDFGETIEADAKYTTTITFADGFERGEHIVLPDSFYELVVSQDRPDHWWRLDEAAGPTVADSGVASSASGDVTGTVTFGSADGVPFDGGRTGAQFSSASSGFIRTSAVSMGTTCCWEAWIRTTDTTNFGYVWGMASYLTYALSPQMVSLNQGGSGRIGVAILESSAYRLTSTALSSIFDGEPHHIVLNCSPSGWDLIVDTVSVLSNTHPFVGLTLPMSIGSDYALFGSSATQNDVTISNVATYGDRTLSSAQILDHYNAGLNACSGEDTGTHLDRVLDYAKWPASLRSIDTGASNVGANDLDGSNLAAVTRQMGSTELGQTYFDLDGNLVHRSRHNVILDTRSSTVQATFGDVTSGEDCKYIDEGFEFPLDNTQLRNPVRASRRGGITAIARDQTLIDDTYGDNTYDAPQSLDEDDNVMADRANLILGRWKNPARWLRAMTIDPTMDVTNLQPQLQRRIGDRIEVKRTPLATGNENTAEIIIQKVRHEGTPFTRLATFAGTAAETRRYWILGDATYGLLGTTTTLGY